MIHEILGSCLIKRQLIELSEEEILKALNTEYNFLYWLTSLNKVTIDEKFLASDPKIFEKARNILRKKRFDYSNNPKIISLCNSLIGYCNEYDAFPQNVKYRLQREWIIQEIHSRNLPKWFRGPKALLDLNAHDYKNVLFLFNVSEESHFCFQSFDIQSTIAWLINRYPVVFEIRETRTIYEDGNFYKLRTGNHALTITKMLLDMFEGPELKLSKVFKKKTRQLQNQLEKFGTPEEKVVIEIKDIYQKSKRKS